MTQRSELPQDIRNLVGKWGLQDAHLGNLQKMRHWLAQGAELGTLILPDFILHNERHSDNAVRLLADLCRSFPLDNLTPYEAYLLVAGIYLHDLGMYIGEEDFQRDIEPVWRKTLLFCPEGRCDQSSNYDPGGKPPGEQIRELHNLIGAYRIGRESSKLGLDEEDLAYLPHIVRGHRRVDLRADCECFRTAPHVMGDIRVALLASLIRLLDALDFGSHRAPQAVFEANIPHFLQNPTALEHWLTHYFAIRCDIQSQIRRREPGLAATIYFDVPAQLASGQEGRDFFEPLFERHLKYAGSSDVRIDQYPPQFIEPLGIQWMRITPEIDQRGGRPLPPAIAETICECRALDAVQFIEWLQSRCVVGDITDSLPYEEPVSLEIESTSDTIRERMAKAGHESYLESDIGLESLARGIAYRYWGQTQKARRLLTHSAEVFELSHDKYDLAQTYIALGDVERTEDHPEAAFGWFDKAATTLRTLPRDQDVMLMCASTLWARAKVNLDRGELEEAFRRLQEAKRLVTEDSHSLWGLEICSQQLGRYYMQKGEYGFADDFFQASLRYSERSPRAQLHRRAETLIHLAELCLKLPALHHRFLDYLDEGTSLAAQERPPYYGLVADACRIRARFGLINEEYQQAFDRYFDACHNAAMYQPWLLEEIALEAQGHLLELESAGLTDLVNKIRTGYRATWRKLALDQAPGGLRFMAALETPSP